MRTYSLTSCVSLLRLRRRWLLLALVLLAGCGYQLAATPSITGTDGALQSISVPIFMNDSGEPELEKRLTAAVRRAFITDGRLPLRKAGAADAVLEGRISSYRQQPLAFDDFDNVTQYRLHVILDTTLRLRRTNQVVRMQQYSAVKEYSLPGRIAGRETARRTALDAAYRQLSQQLVKSIIEGF